MRTLVPARFLLWVAGAAVAFHLAYGVAGFGLFIIVYLSCLLQLARAESARQAFYLGLGTGMLTVAPQLTCFWTIFGPTAIVLWLILAFWIGLFVALARLCLVRFGSIRGMIFIPVLWTGLEYFRSELYYLRFSWLNVGYVLSDSSLRSLLHWAGMYGAGFLAMAAAVGLSIFRGPLSLTPCFSWVWARRQRENRFNGLSRAVETVETVPTKSGSLPTQLKQGVNERGLRWRSSVCDISRLAACALSVLLLHACGFVEKSAPNEAKTVHVAGVQMEFPIPTEVITALDKMLVADPATELFILSEYTFVETTFGKKNPEPLLSSSPGSTDAPIPEKVLNWCREHQRYLIVGGKEDGPNKNFYNTAFVVGPTGEIIFRQAKSVPIQFFKDGLPAEEQKLWDSPWGKIGICICYDLSYTRVTDRLIRLGAQAIIVPTMDVAEWGRHQHELHARVAPVRAAEYGVPIFRLASSGISQCVDRAGRVTATAPFPGPEAMLSGRLILARPGSLPLDRWLAPLASGVTGAMVLWFIFSRKRANPKAEIQRPKEGRMTKSEFGLRPSDFGLPLFPTLPETLATCKGKPR